MPEKIVLAYSGGLDTSVAIRWLKEDRGYDVVALTVDVGMDRTREELERAPWPPAPSNYVWRDVQDEFVRYFVFPALMAGALYQGVYPLATALPGRSSPADGRRRARRRRHGRRPRLHRQGQRPGALRCHRPGPRARPEDRRPAPRVGDGPRVGDRVRAGAQHPGHRHQEEPLLDRREPLRPQHRDRALEDPWTEPPEDVWQWTKSPQDTPDEPAYVEIGFEHGMPVSLDGKAD